MVNQKLWGTVLVGVMVVASLTVLGCIRDSATWTEDAIQREINRNLNAEAFGAEFVAAPEIKDQWHPPLSLGATKNMTSLAWLYPDEGSALPAESIIEFTCVNDNVAGTLDVVCTHVDGVMLDPPQTLVAGQEVAGVTGPFSVPVSLSVPLDLQDNALGLEGFFSPSGGGFVSSGVRFFNTGTAMIRLGLSEADALLWDDASKHRYSKFGEHGGFYDVTTATGSAGPSPLPVQFCAPVIAGTTDGYKIELWCEGVLWDHSGGYQGNDDQIVSGLLYTQLPNGARLGSGNPGVDWDSVMGAAGPKSLTLKLIRQSDGALVAEHTAGFTMFIPALVLDTPGNGGTAKDVSTWTAHVDESYAGTWDAEVWVLAKQWSEDPDALLGTFSLLGTTPASEEFDLLPATAASDLFRHYSGETYVDDGIAPRTLRLRLGVDTAGIEAPHADIAISHDMRRELAITAPISGTLYQVGAPAAMYLRLAQGWCGSVRVHRFILWAIEAEPFYTKALSLAELSGRSLALNFDVAIGMTGLRAYWYDESSTARTSADVAIITDTEEEAPPLPPPPNWPPEEPWPPPPPEDWPPGAVWPPDHGDDPPTGWPPEEPWPPPQPPDWPLIDPVPDEPPYYPPWPPPAPEPWWPPAPPPPPEPPAPPPGEQSLSFWRPSMGSYIAREFQATLLYGGMPAGEYVTVTVLAVGSDPMTTGTTRTVASFGAYLDTAGELIFPCALDVLDPEGAYTLFATVSGATCYATTSTAVLYSETGLPPAPPVIKITAPPHASSISRTIDVKVTATDDRAVRDVAIYLDGGLVGVRRTPNDGATGYTFRLDTTIALNGVHNISAIAWDVDGLSAAAQIYVTTTNTQADLTRYLYTVPLGVDANGNQLNEQSALWLNRNKRRTIEVPILPDVTGLPPNQVYNVFCGYDYGVGVPVWSNFTLYDPRNSHPVSPTKILRYGWCVVPTQTQASFDLTCESIVRMVPSETGDPLLLCSTPHALVRFSAQTGAFTTPIDLSWLANDPVDVAACGGKLFVAHGARVLVIDKDTGELTDDLDVDALTSKTAIPALATDGSTLFVAATVAAGGSRIYRWTPTATTLLASHTDLIATMRVIGGRLYAGTDQGDVLQVNAGTSTAVLSTTEAAVTRLGSNGATVYAGVGTGGKLYRSTGGWGLHWDSGYTAILGLTSFNGYTWVGGSGTGARYLWYERQAGSWAQGVDTDEQVTAIADLLTLTGDNGHEQLFAAATRSGGVCKLYRVEIAPPSAYQCGVNVFPSLAKCLR